MAGLLLDRNSFNNQIIPQIQIRSASTTPSYSPSVSSSSSHDPFEDELNASPDTHFLSPIQMYEYEDWADDSDDSGAEEVEWNAGITDFALFDRDRRTASARQELVPGKWQSLLASQASALQRAVERNRADSASTSSNGQLPPPTPTVTGNSRQWTPLMEDLPQLTPDNSPNLRDDFDIEAHCRRGAKLSVPNYLHGQPYLPHLALPSSGKKSFPTVARTHSPSEEFMTGDFTDDEDDDKEDYDDSDLDDSDDEADVPVAVLIRQAQARRLQARKLQRPGLRSSRTMSGKVHVWRRPSRNIYPLGEDVEAEAAAEA